MQHRLLICIVCLMMVIVTACGGASQQGSSDTAQESSKDDTEDNKDSADVKAEAEIEKESSGTILIDTEDFRVEYKGIGEQNDDHFWTMDFLVENHTDSSIVLDVNKLVVNDYLIGITSGGVAEVPAGESLVDNTNEINIWSVQYYKISNLDTLKFNLVVNGIDENGSRTELYSTDVALSENIPIPSSDRRPGEYNTVLYETDETVIKTAGVYFHGTEQRLLDVLIENNSDYEMSVKFPNMKVNGQDIVMSNSSILLPPHSKCSSAMYYNYIFRDEDLEALGITDIETMTFDIEIDNEPVKRDVSIDNKGNLLEEENVEEQNDPKEEEHEADNANTSAEEETLDSGIDGIIIDETAWNEWKDENKVALMTFMKATSTAGVKWDLPSGQKNSQHKDGYILEDGEKVDGIEMYYAVENQDIYYVGLNAVDEDMFHSDEFKDYCAAFLRGYTATSGEELTMSEERAREIVDYAIDNNQRCIADGVRIRINEIDGGFGFHMEY